MWQEEKRRGWGLKLSAVFLKTRVRLYYRT